MTDVVDQEPYEEGDYEEGDYEEGADEQWEQALPRFSDSFWGEKGWEALSQHVIAGQKAACKEIMHFFEERARIEDRYATDMMKLGEAGGSDSHAIGTLRNAVMTMRGDTLNYGKQHKDYSKFLKEEVIKSIRAFYKKEEQPKTKAAAKIKNGYKNLNKLYKELDGAKAKYHRVSQEADLADYAFDRTKREAGNLGPGSEAELTKLEGKARKLNTQALSLEQKYYTLYTALSNEREKFEQAAHETMENFQSLEEEYSEFLKTAMSTAFEREKAELAHAQNRFLVLDKIMEQVNRDQDIQGLISDKGGLGERPPLPPYEEYARAHPVTAQPADSDVAAIHRKSVRKSLFFRRKKDGASAGSAGKLPKSGSQGSIGSMGSAAESNQATSSAGSFASHVSGASEGGAEARFKVRALYAYAAEDQSELSFDEGQEFECLDQDDSGWWQAEINGRRGLIASNYVEMVGRDA